MIDKNQAAMLMNGIAFVIEKMLAEMNYFTCYGCLVACSHLLLCVQITIEAMKSDIDEVALQGVEFWSNVCDEEMDLAIEATEVMLSSCSVLLRRRARS